MTKPLPEIARCPYPGCGRQPYESPLLGHKWCVRCDCGARGPVRKTRRGATIAWNHVAAWARFSFVERGDKACPKS